MKQREKRPNKVVIENLPLNGDGAGSWTHVSCFFRALECFRSRSDGPYVWCYQVVGDLVGDILT